MLELPQPEPETLTLKAELVDLEPERRVKSSQVVLHYQLFKYLFLYLLMKSESASC